MNLYKLFIPVIFLILLPFVSAQVPPLNVHQFYGDVINGLDGDIVKAVVNGNEFTTTVSAGKYGYNPTFNVEGGTNGDTVVFYINNVEVASSTYDEQGLTKLDLTRPASAPPPSGGGTSGGGTSGGGGGSFWSSVPTSSEGEECVEDWICDVWSECSAGQQTRDCVDQNACGTELLKPAEVKACEEVVVVVETPPEILAPPPLPPEPVKLVKKPEPESSLWLWILLVFVILLIVAVSVFAFFYFFRKESAAGKSFMSADRLVPLRAYVRKTKAMGYTDAQVRGVLAKAGWKSVDINQVIPAPVRRVLPVKTPAAVSRRPVRR